MEIQFLLRLPFDREAPRGICRRRSRELSAGPDEPPLDRRARSRVDQAASDRDPIGEREPPRAAACAVRGRARTCHAAASASSARARGLPGWPAGLGAPAGGALSAFRHRHRHRRLASGASGARAALRPQRLDVAPRAPSIRGHELELEPPRRGHRDIEKAARVGEPEGMREISCENEHSARGRSVRGVHGDRTRGAGLEAQNDRGAAHVLPFERQIPRCGGR